MSSVGTCPQPPDAKRPKRIRSIGASGLKPAKSTRRDWPRRETPTAPRCRRCVVMKSWNFLVCTITQSHSASTAIRLECPMRRWILLFSGRPVGGAARTVLAGLSFGRRYRDCRRGAGGRKPVDCVSLGKAVAERVRRGWLLYSDHTPGRGEGPVQLTWRCRVNAALTGKQPACRPRLAPIVAQQVRCRR